MRQNDKVQKLMSGMAILNTIFLATAYYNESQKISEVRGIINIVFTAIFSCELLYNISKFRMEFLTAH